jgi:hypothetical protein
MRPRLLLISFVAAVGITACSQAVSSNSAANPLASIATSESRWTANFRSVNNARSTLTDTTREKSFGSAEWRPGPTATQSKIDISFTYGGVERELTWGILFGNCGSASLPVVPTSNFPELELTGVGSTKTNATINLEFPTSGTYHIDIYRDRTGSSESIVACGNLKYSR